MRKIKRSSTPKCLTNKNANGVTRKNEVTSMWTAKLNRGRGSSSWDWYGLNLILRPKLLEITHSHCAFCDKKFNKDEAANSVEIEHFKSKVNYPNLAFNWTNLFPICRACNSKKGEDFDSKILKPDTVRYNFKKYFIFNFKNGDISPNPMKSKRIQDRAKVTIDIYQLNRGGLPNARLDTLNYYNMTSSIIPDINFYDYRDFIELGT